MLPKRGERGKELGTLTRSKSVYLSSWDDSLLVDFEEKLLNLSKSGKLSTEPNTFYNQTGRVYVFIEKPIELEIGNLKIGDIG